MLKLDRMDSSISKLDKTFWKDFWHILKPYWLHSEEKKKAWLLFFVIIFLNLFQVFLNVLFTKWYKVFYDALQHFDEKGFWKALLEFSILATLFIVSAVYATYLQQMLQIKWRAWLTSFYISKWVSNKKFYHMQVIEQNTDNPDQRIADDVNAFISQSLSLFLGLMSSVVTFFSFVGMLWIISGPISFDAFHIKITIPAYMVWAAIIYAIAGTYITAKIGKPLVKLNFDQQMFEANFRFALIRIRENSESVALLNAEEKEHQNLMDTFRYVFQNYWQIMVRQKMLGWFTSGYNQIAIIFPILVAAPRFFAKKIQLGDVMQIASAFGQVQSSLSFIVNSYSSIATWYSVVDRLRTFEKNIKAIETSQRQSKISILPSQDKLAIEHLSIKIPYSEKLIVKDLNLTIEKKEHTIIMGPSGVGKSTLIRAIAGIWPFGEGTIKLPPNHMFLPQKPYFPYGSIREILLYPSTDGKSIPNEYLEELLDLVGLSYLSKDLNTKNLWSQVLSPGEQQSLNIARVLLHTPDWLFMDESTSALNEEKEIHLYKLLLEKLKNLTIVSVAHRKSLENFHVKKLILKENATYEIITLDRAKNLI